MIMVEGGHLHISLILVCVAAVEFPRAVGLENQIRKFIYNNNGLGAYSFEFQTADGTYRKEDGGMASNAEDRSLVVRGEYGYLDHLGRLYSVKYVADSNGFQPFVTQDDTRFNDRRYI